MPGGTYPLAFEPFRWRPELVEAARKVAGREPPPWFVSNFHGAAASLSQHHIRDGKDVDRKDMRNRLRAVAKAARLIVHELHSVEAGMFLEWDGLLEHGNETVHTLNEIAERAEKEARAIPVGEGRFSATAPFIGIKTTTWCALVIVEAWTVMRGKPPGARNTQAAEAAEALWQATEGPSRSRGNPAEVDGLDRWYRPFKAVLGTPKQDQDRARWRLHLSYGRQNTP